MVVRASWLMGVTLGSLISLGCGDDAATTSAGGGGAAGGGPSSTSSGGGGSAGDGGGGSGGAPAACTLGGAGCVEGEKCSIVDEGLGAPAGVGCVEAGPGQAFEACDADIACGAGLYCDYTTAVCKPLCGQPGLECGSADDCVVGRDSSGSPIPGLFVCLAACNPVSASVNPCADDPSTTCFYRADEAAFDCGLSEQGGWMSPCDSGRDCRFGLGCFDGYCQDWCSDVGSANGCYGTKADGTWFCDQFEPCGPCEATRFEAGGAPLGSCTAWGM